jgi:hypothetical protein
LAGEGTHGVLQRCVVLNDEPLAWGR